MTKHVLAELHEVTSSCTVRLKMSGVARLEQWAEDFGGCAVNFRVCALKANCTFGTMFNVTPIFIT